MSTKTRQPAATPATDGHDRERIGDDLLRGAQAIADELGIPLRQTRWLLERGRLPARKLGAIWYASRSRLREFFVEEAAE